MSTQYRTMTITEALAELRMIDKRIEKKREFIGAYLLRPERLKDPLEKDGGSFTAIASEMQSVRDLEEEKVRIRRAIQRANEATSVTVGKQERSIADWLVWRRDVAPGSQAFLRQVSGAIARHRQEALKTGAKLTSQDDASGPNDIVVNLNERTLSETIEDLDASLETLDGQLSLKNATTTINW